MAEPASTAHAPSSQCDHQAFVACSSGEDCATRQGKLLKPKPCFARAAEACNTLGCEHGCLLNHGAPKQVMCAPNSHTTSNGFTRCGGLGNWACPENTRCELAATGTDAFGTCVAIN